MVLHNPKPLPGLEVPTLPARTTQIHFVEKPVNAIKTWMICYNSCAGVCFISKRSFLGLEVPYLPARTIKPHFVAKLVICWNSGVDIDVDVITQWHVLVSWRHKLLLHGTKNNYALAFKVCAVQKGSTISACVGQTDFPAMDSFYLVATTRHSILQEQ